MKKIKWRIVACGNIANKFSSDLALIKDVEITAVASRNLEKTQAFAVTPILVVLYSLFWN